jgi:hypothetical protein
MGGMTPSSPSFTGYTPLRRGRVRPLGTIGTVILAIVLVLALYFIGREVLLNGHALFEGGR